jgi:hypothetical protein
VIALREGGVLDTVIEDRTGALFDEPTVDALLAAVQAFRPDDVDPLDCVASAARYDVSHFRDGMRRIVDDALREAQDGDGGAAARRRPPRRVRGLALSA